MKVSRIVVAAFAGLFALTALAGPPFPIQRAESLAEGQQMPAGFARLRLSLSTNDSSSDSQIQVGNVTVCSDSACFQSTVAPFVDLTDNRSGVSTPIATILIPYGQVRSLQLETVAGPKTAAGEIVLQTPLEIPEGFFGGEILVILKKKVVHGAATYVPTAAATGLFHDEGVSVYYNPKFPLDKTLKFGATLSLPAGATALPQIFHVAVHDTGDDFPLIDIYPEVSLLKPASLQVSAISRKPRSLAADEPPTTPRPQNAPPPGVPNAVSATANTPRSRTITLRKTGVVHSGSAPSSQAEPDVTQYSAVAAAVPMNPQGWTDCTANISYPPNQTIIANGLQATGTEYLDWCTTIPSYIHIGVSTLADAREVFSVRYSPEGFVNNATQLPLTRITQWSPSTQMMVNGFPGSVMTAESLVSMGLPKGT